ncbi:putative entry exclusion protein TrbK-alt [Taklimakanibacter lacteus]|uniref:putative entry exclusion protein TrbK-alt n=1 Tax=Taklimakanibacter lacteus TaxID=2268456 RepID=UPI000E66E2B1
MDMKIATRMLAVLAFAAVMAACAIALRPDRTEDAPAQTVQPRGDEPASSELVRCRDIGAAALDDPACRKAWSDSRRHFLGGAGERPRP